MFSLKIAVVLAVAALAQAAPQLDDHHHFSLSSRLLEEGGGGDDDHHGEHYHVYKKEIEIPVVHKKIIKIPVVHKKVIEVKKEEYHHEEEPKHYPKYTFAYSVKDEKHHDIKEQKETRDGHKVTGEYSLVEPDGHIRTVKYTADKKTGFNAEVHRTAPKYTYHPEPVKKVEVHKKIIEIPIKKKLIEYHHDEDEYSHLLSGHHY